MRHFRSEIWILNFGGGGLKPVRPLVPKHDVHGLGLLGDRDGEIAEFLEVRAGFLDGFAVDDALGMLGHGAVFVVFGHCARRLLGTGQIVLEEGGRDCDVTFEGRLFESEDSAGSCAGMWRELF